MRTSSHSAIDAARTTSALFGVLALGVLAWVLALLGVLSVTGALPGSGAFASALSVGSIEGLPEYPGARPAEFREEVFGDERVIEIEYRVDSSVADVRAHYREALARGGWTLSDAAWLYGEWAYTASRGAHHATVEIEAKDGLTEVEIELTEPAAARSLLAPP